jgi:TrmH family RNA methyltransferase
MMKRITSRQNPAVARYRSAARGESADMILLDGVHLIEEALASDATLQQVIVAADALERPEVAALVERLARHHVDTLAASAPVMAVVSPVRSASKAVALAARPPDGRKDVFAPPALVVIACDLQDPGNMGAVIRVAEAAGATGVIAAGACADPFGWKALRGSMGSALRLPIVVRATPEAAMLDARTAGCRIVATVPRGGTELTTASLAGSLALLIGSEGSGVPPALVDLADICVTIPMKAPVESLNAAVTTAVTLYEAARQRGAPAGS